MFDSLHAAPIQAKDVGVGTLVWYKGFTSSGSWNCPAVMYQVDKDDEFYVMSLDDMCEQHQAYCVGRDPYGTDWQKNMRLASVAEVDAYLAERNKKKNAFQIIAMVQAAARKCTKEKTT